MYQNIQQTADFYGISRRTVSRRVREMEGIYPRAVLRGDKLVLVEMEAFEHYITHRKEIMRGERNEGDSCISNMRSYGRKS